MRGNLLHIIVVQIWILSISSAPLARLLLPEDNNIGIALNDGWEEESGASDNIYPDFEKLVPGALKFSFFYKDVEIKEALVHFTPRLCNHITDVIIPPPEGSLL